MARRFAVVVMLVAVIAVVSSCVYDEHGVLPGDVDASVTGIDANGDLVGYSYGVGSSAIRKLAGGSFAKLSPMSGDTDAKAAGINDAGTVVGSSWGGNDGLRAVTWNVAGVATALPGSSAQGNAINQAGDVAGDIVMADAEGSQYPHAHLWKVGAAAPIELPLPAGATFSQATGINIHDDVSGYAYDPTIGYVGMRWHTSTGTYDVIGGGFPYGINDAGTLVGSFNNMMAIWTVGQSEPQLATGIDPGYEAEGLAINNNGIVVGYGIVSTDTGPTTTTSSSPPTTAPPTTAPPTTAPPTTAPPTTTTSGPPPTTVVQHAIGWNTVTGVITDLGALDFGHSRADAVNVHGVPAGDSVNRAVTFSAVP